MKTLLMLLLIFLMGCDVNITSTTTPTAAAQPPQIVSSAPQECPTVLSPVGLAQTAGSTTIWTTTDSCPSVPFNQIMFTVFLGNPNQPFGHVGVTAAQCDENNLCHQTDYILGNQSSGEANTYLDGAINLTLTCENEQYETDCTIGHPSFTYSYAEKCGYIYINGCEFTFQSSEQLN